LPPAAQKAKESLERGRELVAQIEASKQRQQEYLSSSAQNRASAAQHQVNAKQHADNVKNLTQEKANLMAQLAQFKKKPAGQ